MVQGNLLAAGVLPADSGSLLLVGDIVGSFGVAFLIGRYESGDGWFVGVPVPDERVDPYICVLNDDGRKRPVLFGFRE